MAEFGFKKFSSIFLLLLLLQILLRQTESFRRRTHFRESTSRLANRHRSDFVIDIKMPGVSPKKPEEYLCTASKRLSRRTLFIRAYEPHAKATTAHHILLFGCKYPASRKRSWKCSTSVCHGNEKIIYAWAKNAKAVKMPDGVGFAIGGNSGIDYIVMQVHYAKAMKAGEYDHSGIKLHVTSKSVKHTAAIFVMASDYGKIPPRSLGYHVDIACQYDRLYDIIPFAYRTHAHSTARVISGYRVRDGKWTLIGIGNPQLPQVFYPIPSENRTVIHRGDIMAARCTYDTPKRDRWTYMGATSKDEMCNFYMMFYKVYKGSHHFRRTHDANECSDIEEGTPKKLLKFPKTSDKLPDYLKTNKTHHHHHMGDVPEEDDTNKEAEGPEDRNTETDNGDEDRDDGADDDDNEDNREPDEDNGWNIEDDADSAVSNRNDEKHSKASPGPSSEKADNDRKKTSQAAKTNNIKKNPKSEKTKQNNADNSLESDLDNLISSTSSRQKEKQGVPHKTAKKKSKNMIPPVVNGDWPYERADLLNIGQVSGLALDGNHLILFHRADRVWDQHTFNSHNQLNRLYRVKITQPTVLHLDTATGAVKKKWGQNRFYLPHGLTVDHKRNIWVTDVGAHQVFKFSPNDTSRPLMTLGVSLIPGKDDDHFCKPADVAVESSGVFFVADGYCNNRIMKFSANGDLIMKWGRPNGHGKPRPGQFNIPHSLALDEKNGLLYVADRENGRIQCFDTNGKFQKQIFHKEFGGRLFAVSYTPAEGGLLLAVSGPSFKKNGPKPSGFTINPKNGIILNKWSPFSRGFSRPHDVQSTPDNSAVYVAEIGPNRVWKFNNPVESKRQVSDTSSETLKDAKKGNAKKVKTSPSKQEKKNPIQQTEEIEEETPSGDTGYTLKKPEPDSTVVPAIVVVTVLATPIALICAAATIQHLRFKHKRNKAVNKRNSATLTPKSKSGCFSCCKTKKYYYDNKRGFDKLIGEEDSDESSDDYFVRKGAI